MAERRNASDIEQQLRGQLYRFDCPSPMSIGEYALDLLAEPSRSDLARHVLGCSLCTLELGDVRAYLTTDPPLPAPSVWHGLRRTIAALFVPTPSAAFGTLRGGPAGEGAEYRAGSLKIVVGHVAGARRGRVSIGGLILSDDAPLTAVADREVTLKPDQQPLLITRTDDLGSFAFEDVDPGSFTLEVTLAEEIVVVEDLHIGR